MTRPPDQEPVEKGEKGIHADSRQYTHPAFAMISASRVSASPPGVRLVGSEFHHGHFITVRIKTAQLNRDLNRDWYFGNQQIVEVALSEAQWAQFVSSLNFGDGTPCTLEWTREDGMIPGIAAPRRQTDETAKEIRKKLGDLRAYLGQIVTDVQTEIGVYLPKKKREAVFEHINKVVRAVNDSLPFMSETFERQMEKTIEKAKVEIHAHASSVVQQAGLAALRGEHIKAPEVPPIALIDTPVVPCAINPNCKLFHGHGGECSEAV